MEAEAQKLKMHKDVYLFHEETVMLPRLPMYMIRKYRTRIF